MMSIEAFTNTFQCHIQSISIVLDIHSNQRKFWYNGVLYEHWSVQSSTLKCITLLTKERFEMVLELRNYHIF